MIFLIIEKFFIDGGISLLYSLLDAIIAFGAMYLLKLIGDFVFKKETMGGGDIKLLFVLGFVLGWEMALISIVLGAFIGLPISVLVLYIKKNRVVPFGPFLVMAALNIFLLKIDLNILFNFIEKILFIA